MTDTHRARERRPAPEGVALYARLASTLRQQIAGGQWEIGEQLPPVAALAAEHGVAIVTVRQAIRLLVEEGLLSSGRGVGTLLRALPPAPTDALRSAINDPHAHQQGLKIEVLSVRTVQHLPEKLRLGGARSAGPYVCLRKIHTHDGAPFCAMSIYMEETAHRRLARGSWRANKIIGLLIKHCRADIARMRTTVTIAPADLDTSHQLACDFGAPLAHVVRCITNKQGAAIYAGEFRYVGDRFILDFETDIDALAKQSEGLFSHLKDEPGTGA